MGAVPALQRYLLTEIGRRGWSMEQFADHAQISLSNAYLIVRDGKDNVRQNTFDNIAAALGMTPAGLASMIGKGDSHEQIDARRQLVRDQLDRWLAAVGPEHEDYFWEALKAQGDSVVDLIRQVGTAVNEGAQAAVNAAVSGRKSRTRPKRGDSSGALKDYYHSAGRVLGRHHFSVTAAAAL
jgi:transcriptional regulator with XRE-family HTH domain